MKKLALLTTLLVFVMFSSDSYGKWTKIGVNVDGINVYVDIERIRKHDGYVYCWKLMAYR